MVVFKDYNVYQQTICSFVANTFVASEETTQLQKVFRIIDTDDNGTISLAELEDFLNSPQFADN